MSPSVVLSVENGSQNHTIIIGKDSNTQKCWKTKEFMGAEGFSEEQQAEILGHHLLMNRFDYFSNSMSTNLNVKAYNDILGNCVLLIL